MPNIRWLESDDEIQAKQVWRECFGDEPGFIDAYFSYAASFENGLGCFDGEELIADLFILDFWASLSGADYTAAFLAGCATLPKARKRGLMRDLIKNVLTVLKENGTETVYLHPFLHSFYRKFGFETIAYVYECEITCKPELAEYDVVVSSSPENVPVQDMSRSYTAYVTKYDNFFRRTAKRMNIWLALLFSDGGKVAYVKDEAGVSYALFYENEGVAEVFELVYANEKQRDALVNSLGTERCKYFIPAHESGEQANASEFTMMRVLRPADVLQKHAYEADASFVIHIKDSFMDAEYNISVEVRRGIACVEETDAPADFETDMAGFAKLVSGAHSGGLPECMKTAFPQCTGCYFETY